MKNTQEKILLLDNKFAVSFGTLIKALQLRGVSEKLSKIDENEFLSNFVAIHQYTGRSAEDIISRMENGQEMRAGEIKLFAEIKALLENENK